MKLCKKDSMTRHFDTNKDDLTGSSSAYYKLPEDATDIQDLIEHRNMNFAQGNILKAIYRIGEKPGVDAIYDLKKIIWFANREINRISKNNPFTKKNPLPTTTKYEDKFKSILEDEKIKAREFLDKERGLISNIMKNVDINAPVGTEIVYMTGDKAGQPIDPTDTIEEVFAVGPDGLIQVNYIEKPVEANNEIDINRVIPYNEPSFDESQYLVFTTPASTVNPTWDETPSWLEASEASFDESQYSDDTIEIISNPPMKRKKK